MHAYLGISFLRLTTSSAFAADPVLVRTVDHLGDRYTVVTVHLGGDVELSLCGGHAGGLTFGDARTEVGQGGRTAVALMNGGMYGTDGGPLGLFVDNGVELHPIDLGSGSGNFYLKPNGVFWVDVRGIAHVTVSTSYVTLPRQVSLATQSGPMLIVDGVVQPELNPTSTNKLRCNAVGVSDDGKTVHLVISDGDVRFYDLATLFRDKLSCNNALYLDGVVSNVWTDGSVPSARYGSVIAVTRRK